MVSGLNESIEVDAIFVLLGDKVEIYIDELLIDWKWTGQPSVRSREFARRDVSVVESKVK